MFQECKKEILVRYCTIKSSSEIVLDMKIGQVWSDVYIEYVSISHILLNFIACVALMEHVMQKIH